MNGQTTVNPPTNNNEQLIGKFHVVNVDRASTNHINNHDEASLASAQQHHPPSSAPVTSTAADESVCGSRFQMIRVDRNFNRGRWKVNDYEPPENVSTSINPPVNTTENDLGNISNASTLSTVPTATATMTATTPNHISSALPIDSNSITSAKLAATAASVAAATATAFQQQQQLLAMNNPASVVPTAAMPPPNSLLHPYPPAALANLAAQNQPYLLQNHPQFGYYPFYHPAYPHYAAQWTALNHFLPPPQMQPPQQQTSQLATGNLGDPNRHVDSDAIGENPFLSSLADHLQSVHMTAANAAPLVFAPTHPHSAYLSQGQPTSVSPYATISPYHTAPPLPTIIPTLPLAPVIPNNTTDIQSQLSHQGPAPLLTSPKHETAPTKPSLQPSYNPKITTAPARSTVINGTNTDTSKPTATNPTQITDLLSSSPSISSSQQLPPSLLSPMTVPTTNANKAPTTSLTDIWSLTSANSPLTLSQAAAQTAAATAVAAMGLLNNNSGKNAEMTNEILKELTTPTKQNNLPDRRTRFRYMRQLSTTDIDNKISAAMDLVKMHLLSAVREEVTELRQQIRILNEKVTSVEHENAFLRQHVPSEISAQYMPLPAGLPATNDSSNSTATVPTTASSVLVPSSQPIAMASLSSFPASLAQQPISSTITPQPPASINLPPT